MRKISRVLGIVGSVLAILMGGVMIYDAATYSYVTDDYYYEYFDDYEEYDTLAATAADKILPGQGGIIYEADITNLVFGSCVVLGGLLGAIASVYVTKKNVFSGVLFIIAAVLCIFSIVPMVLFIIAAVQAMGREKRPVPPVWLVPVPPGVYPGYYPAAAVPTGGQPVYPPYGAYPPPPWPPSQPAGAQPAAAYAPYGAYPPSRPSAAQPAAAYPPWPYPHPQPAGAQPTAAYPPYGAYPPPWPHAYTGAGAPPQGPPPPPPPEPIKED